MVAAIGSFLAGRRVGLFCRCTQTSFFVHGTARISADARKPAFLYTLRVCGRGLSCRLAWTIWSRYLMGVLVAETSKCCSQRGRSTFVRQKTSQRRQIDVCATPKRRRDDKSTFVWPQKCRSAATMHEIAVSATPFCSRNAKTTFLRSAARFETSHKRQIDVSATRLERSDGLACRTNTKMSFQRHAKSGPGAQSDAQTPKCRFCVGPLARMGCCVRMIQRARMGRRALMGHCAYPRPSTKMAASEESG